MYASFIVGTNAYDWGNFADALEARRRGRRMVGDETLDECSRTMEAMAVPGDSRTSTNWPSLSRGT